MAVSKKKAPSRAKPAKPIPRTREELLRQMAHFLASVDKYMGGERKASANNYYSNSSERTVTFGYQYGTDLGKAQDGLRALMQQLDELERGEKLDKEKPGAEAVARAHFSTAPGEPLLWSRPGSGLTWMDDIPVRIEWGGFLLKAETALFALDPRRMFLSGAGFEEVAIYQVKVGLKTPEDLIRHVITGRLESRYGGSGGLRLLDQEGRKAVQSFRDDPANAWWIEAAAGEPVKPVSIPLNLAPVQVTLFG